MSGTRAALKVAASNARRNRKRTLFLVLLVAVPVALGLAVAGLIRASTITSEERVQLDLGSADAAVHIQTGEEVVPWIDDNLHEIDPSILVTAYRRTGVRIEGYGFGRATDLDLKSPMTEGMLVLMEGTAPVSPGEVAISPSVVEEMGLRIGDLVAVDGFGDLEIVSVVGDPISRSDFAILLWPEALAGTPNSLVLLMGGDNAESATLLMRERWWSEGGVSVGRDTPTEVSPVMGSVHFETRTELLNQGSLIDEASILATAASSLLLIEVAFITGAAFAAGTRRRLREIGLLGSTGASERHVRATVIGEGLTIGLVGAAVGVVLGLAVLTLGRPLLQPFVSKLITGFGVGLTDVVGPVVAALVAVLIAVWMPARTASRIPTKTALLGRMPAVPPRRWIIPIGLAASALGALLITVSIASTSSLSGSFVGLGAVMVVGGVAMLTSPILAGISKLADHIPTTGRLVLRDSGRHRTRSSVAVAAIMVILLVPSILLVLSQTIERQSLVTGLPQPANHLLLSGIYEPHAFDVAPVALGDILAVGVAVPEREVVIFDALEIEARTQEQMEIEATSTQAQTITYLGPWESQAAVASEELIAALGDERVGAAIGNGQIVVLGVEEKDTTVSLDDEVLSAIELPVPVVQYSMPRILLPPSVAEQFDDGGTRMMALFILDRPLTSGEFGELLMTQSYALDGGREDMSAATVFAIAAAVMVVAVLIVIGLVTAVSAAEVDEDLTTIVAVGAPGSTRRRFLGLLTGYQTFIGAVLAVPLGLGLTKAFTTAGGMYFRGPFGEMPASDIIIPWGRLAAVIVVTPIVVGVLTWLSVRSAPVTPPRRAT